MSYATRDCFKFINQLKFEVQPQMKQRRNNQ